MANDNETLTFRLRAVAENMSAFGKAARGAEDVNAAMIKSKATAEALATSSRKLTAARDKESDAAGRVRVAEQKLNEVRGNTKSKMSQIVAAEERLATARRNSARASQDANKIEADFKKTAERALSKVAQDSGESAGRRFTFGFRKSVGDGSIENSTRKSSSIISSIFGPAGEASGHRFGFGFEKATSDGSMQNHAGRLSKIISKIFGNSGQSAGRSFGSGFKKNFGAGAIADDVEKDSKLIGRTFGSGILSGLEGALKSEAGPWIFAGLVAVVGVAGPAIGAVLAGSIVTAFGAGLVTLGIVFAAKSAVVKAAWKATTHEMGAEMASISKPFEGVLVHMANSVRSTFAKFAPTLQQAFAASAGPVQKFTDDALGALERFKPALLPINRAFDNLLKALGPALQDALGSIADGLIAISDSVSRNPNGLPDFIRSLGDLFKMLSDVITILNDANGAFERLTGGTSAVTIVMQALQAVIGTLLAPMAIMSKYIIFVSDTMNALTHSADVNAKSMSDAANKTVLLAQAAQQSTTSVHEAAAAHAAHAASLAHENTVTNTANAASRALAAAFDRQSAATQHSIDLLNRQADLLLGLAGAQLDYAQAVADATAAVKENGRTHDFATQKGRDNYRALLQVAQAAKVQRDSMLKAGDGNVSAAKSAAASQRGFVKLAVAMGYTLPVAQKMARDFIKIPNVTRTAKLVADKKDLDTKLANAKKQLNDKNLTKERKATLNANILQLTKKVKNAQTQIDKVHGKTPVLNADPRLLQRKTKAAQAQIDHMHGKTPVLNADPRLLQRKTAAAQAQIDHMHGKTPVLNADPRSLQRKAAAAQAQIDHMHGKVVPITYTMNGTNFTLNTKTPSRVGGLAKGGKVRGPGTGTNDQAGMYALSNKEWVIRAKASQKYGEKAMASINNGTAMVVPGMARGGRVGNAIDIHGTGVFKNQAQLRAVLGQKFPPIPAANSTPSGGAGGAARWRGVALSALAAAHEPASWIGSLLHRLNQESGGNPRAINLWDSNAKKGIPSKGLMQVIDPTFNAFANGYRSRGIWDPFANIFAAIKYTVSRYGSGPAGWNRAGGYKNGGWLMPGDSAYNETRKPEAVFNRKQLNEMGGPAKVVFEFRSDGSPYMEFLMSEFKKYVRIRGGDVQKVMGTRG